MIGRYVPVRAAIVAIPAFSVHADRPKLSLVLRSAAAMPEVVYVVHGKPASAEALRATIARELKWHAVVPRYLERVRID